MIDMSTTEGKRAMKGKATKTTRQGRRLPTKAQLAIWRDYIETSELLRSVLASRMQNESGMSLGDYQVLLTLSEAESGQLRSSELAARVGWERSRLSHHLGRMEKRGLIRREPCPEDSRGADVVLSEEGERTFRDGSLSHLEAVHDLFTGVLTQEQMTHLRDAVEALRTGLERGLAQAQQ